MHHDTFLLKGYGLGQEPLAILVVVEDIDNTKTPTIVDTNSTDCNDNTDNVNNDNVTSKTIITKSPIGISTLWSTCNIVYKPMIDVASIEFNE